MGQGPSFYDDHATLSVRGINILKKLTPVLRKLFLEARTPRECMDLERAIHGDVNVTSTLRVLYLHAKKVPVPKKGGR